VNIKTFGKNKKQVSEATWHKPEKNEIESKNFEQMMCKVNKLEE
jgi:hypothetical protein